MRLLRRPAAWIVAAAVNFVALSATPATAGTVVTFSPGHAAGTIVIVNKDRKLFHVLGGGKAIQYPVAIGRTAQVWTGKTHISHKEKSPSWLNPDDPEAEVVPGGPDNPLGERALYLGSTLYRIHGTPVASSIGRAVSNGCIRMYSKDVENLYDRVRIGMKVAVTNSLASAGKVPSRPKVVNPKLYAKDMAAKPLATAQKNETTEQAFLGSVKNNGMKRDLSVVDLTY
jgi:lipoprotein-anchoring transpeptidase ErfK/SrfK